MLSEDDLAIRLSDYRVLFVTDRHLKSAALPPLLAWVHDGGTLYLSAGALERDEFDEPLELDTELGLKRKPLDYRDKPGRAEYEMRALKPLATYQNIRVLCGMQEPLEAACSVGAGRVLQIGFFPGISYIAGSQRAEGADFSVLEFETAHRQWLHALLERNHIQPRLRCDNHRVEANLLRAADADLLTLSNWTGAEQIIRIELDKVPNYKTVAPVAGQLLEHSHTGDTLRLTLVTGAGDIILLRR